jgi:outer membrane protein assembly factor BamB
MTIPRLSSAVRPSTVGAAMRVLLALLLSSSVLLAADWPQFRGPNAAATAATAPPDEWAKGKNVAWTAKIPGSGWASPVVAGDKVFVATAVTDPPFIPKDMQKGVMDPSSVPTPGGKAKAGPDMKIDWQVLCLELATGKEVWTKTAASGKPKYAIHPSNSFATETPCADAERVYAFFGQAGVVIAYDHAGQEAWKLDVGTFPGTADLGLGASPALHDGVLFVPLLNEEKATVLALDAKTGKEKYTITRDKPGTSWATPFVWKNQARTELVICGKGMVSGHDLKDGAELWRFTNVDSSFSSSPTATDATLVFGNGGPGSKSPLVGVKAGAKGDISLKKDETANDYVAFFKTGSAPGMSSAVAADGLVYVPGSGKLTCYDLATGKQIYKETLKNTRVIAASPILADGKLYVTEETGKTLVVKAGKEFELLGTNDLGDLIWSSPAAAGDRLLIRGVKGLYCIKK